MQDNKNKIEVDPLKNKIIVPERWECYCKTPIFAGVMIVEEYLSYQVKNDELFQNGFLELLSRIQEKYSNSFLVTDYGVRRVTRERSASSNEMSYEVWVKYLIKEKDLKQ